MIFHQREATEKWKCEKEGREREKIRNLVQKSKEGMRTKRGKRKEWVVKQLVLIRFMNPSVCCCCW